MWSKTSIRSIGFLMWIILLAAFEFSHLRKRGGIVVVAPAMAVFALIGFWMILEFVRWLDARLSASAAARALRQFNRKR